MGLSNFKFFLSALLLVSTLNSVVLAATNGNAQLTCHASKYDVNGELIFQRDRIFSVSVPAVNWHERSPLKYKTNQVFVYGTARKTDIDWNISAIGSKNDVTWTVGYKVKNEEQFFQVTQVTAYGQATKAYELNMGNGDTVKLICELRENTIPVSGGKDKTVCKYNNGETYVYRFYNDEKKNLVFSSVDLNNERNGFNVSENILIPSSHVSSRDQLNEFEKDFLLRELASKRTVGGNFKEELSADKQKFYVENSEVQDINIKELDLEFKIYRRIKNAKNRKGNNVMAASFFYKKNANSTTTPTYCYDRKKLIL